MSFLLHARCLWAVLGKPARHWRDRSLADEELRAVLGLLAKGPQPNPVALMAHRARAQRALSEAPLAARACQALGDAQDMPSAAAACGLNVRALQRLCERHHGLSPEHLRRLFRLHRSASDLLPELGATSPLASAAADHGYFDQAHMSRDYRLLAQVTPGQLSGDPAWALRAGADLVPNFFGP